MQGSKLYVGNLNYDATQDELSELFSQFGTVKDVVVIPRKGFGFVEMSTTEEAEKAREELNGKDFMGRALRIDEARPRRD